MKVTITDIVLNTWVGEKISIFLTNYALLTCITSQKQLLLEAPKTILSNFEEETGMSSPGFLRGIHYGVMQYLAENAWVFPS